MDVAERLRRTRESRGLTLETLSALTKIPVRSLTAIERSEFDRLPGGLFTREVVSGAIAPRARTTFYTRYGDIFAITAVVGASLAVAGVAVVRLGPGIAPRAVLRSPRQPGRSSHG